jgi:hypothetical protein
LFEVAGSAALKVHERVNIAGMLTADAKLRLLVDGKPAGTAPGMAISRRPFDGLSLGQDSGSRVGQYDTALPFKGELADFRVYWGTLDEAAIGRWADK